MLKRSKKLGYVGGTVRGFVEVHGVDEWQANFIRRVECCVHWSYDSLACVTRLQVCYARVDGEWRRVGPTDYQLLEALRGLRDRAQRALRASLARRAWQSSGPVVFDRTAYGRLD